MGDQDFFFNICNVLQILYQFSNITPPTNKSWHKNNTLLSYSHCNYFHIVFSNCKIILNIPHEGPQKPKKPRFIGDLLKLLLFDISYILTLSLSYISHYLTAL